MLNGFSKISSPTRLLGLVAFSLATLSINSKMASAVDFGAGLVALEDGDDRLRPTAVLHLGTQVTASRFYVYGRDYGPVKERNYLLSVSKRFDIASKSWQGTIGIAGLYDSTVISFADHPEDNMSYNSTNVGAALGLHWNFFELKNFQMKATWDSHVFPAGSGFIFLANARKSGLGITSTMVF